MWKANGFKCGYCPVARDGGGATCLRNRFAGIQVDVVSCKNVPRNVRDVMLDVVVVGRRKKLDTNENRLKGQYGGNIWGS